MNRAVQRLTEAQLADYERDGYLFLRGFFSAEEMAPLQAACAADPEIGGALQAVADSAGKPQEVVSWSRLSDDLVGVFPRVARLVDATEDLIGLPVYHWHSKLSMKKPGSEGRWDWHQDYGYWYYEGCLAPHMATCMIGVDRVRPGEWLRAAGAGIAPAGPHRPYPHRRGHRRRSRSGWRRS